MAPRKTGRKPVKTNSSSTRVAVHQLISKPLLTESTAAADRSMRTRSTRNTQSVKTNSTPGSSKKSSPKSKLSPQMKPTYTESVKNNSTPGSSKKSSPKSKLSPQMKPTYTESVKNNSTPCAMKSSPKSKLSPQMKPTDAVGVVNKKERIQDEVSNLLLLAKLSDQLQRVATARPKRVLKCPARYEEDMVRSKSPKTKASDSVIQLLSSSLKNSNKKVVSQSSSWAKNSNTKTASSPNSKKSLKRPKKSEDDDAAPVKAKVCKLLSAKIKSKAMEPKYKTRPIILISNNVSHKPKTQVSILKHSYLAAERKKNISKASANICSSANVDSVDSQRNVDNLTNVDSRRNVDNWRNVDSQRNVDNQTNVDSQRKVDNRRNVDSQTKVDNRTNVDSIKGENKEVNKKQNVIVHTFPSVRKAEENLSKPQHVVKVIADPKLFRTPRTTIKKVILPKFNSYINACVVQFEGKTFVLKAPPDHGQLTPERVVNGLLPFVKDKSTALKDVVIKEIKSTEASKSKEVQPPEKHTIWPPEMETMSGVEAILRASELTSTSGSVPLTSREPDKCYITYPVFSGKKHVSYTTVKMSDFVASAISKTLNKFTEKGPEKKVKGKDGKAVKSSKLPNDVIQFFKKTNSQGDSNFEKIREQLTNGKTNSQIGSCSEKTVKPLTDGKSGSNASNAVKIGGNKDITSLFDDIYKQIPRKLVQVDDPQNWQQFASVKGVQDTKHPCDQCDEEFTCRTKLRVHIKKEHHVKPMKSYSCSICNLLFGSVQLLKEHKHQAHKKNEDLLKPPSKRMKKDFSECSTNPPSKRETKVKKDSSESFKSTSKRETKSGSESSAKQTSKRETKVKKDASECSAKSTSKSSTSIRLITFTSDTSECSAKQTESSNKCRECKCVLPSEQKLHEHMVKFHTNQAVFLDLILCKPCDEAFMSISEFLIHKRDIHNAHPNMLRLRIIKNNQHGEGNEHTDGVDNEEESGSNSSKENHNDKEEIESLGNSVLDESLGNSVLDESLDSSLVQQINGVITDEGNKHCEIIGQGRAYESKLPLDVHTKEVPLESETIMKDVCCELNTISDDDDDDDDLPSLLNDSAEDVGSAGESTKDSCGETEVTENSVRNESNMIQKMDTDFCKSSPIAVSVGENTKDSGDIDVMHHSKSNITQNMDTDNSKSEITVSDLDNEAAGTVVYPSVSDTNNMAATVVDPSVSDTNNMAATVVEPSVSDTNNMAATVVDPSVSDTNNMATTVVDPSVSDTNNMATTVAEPSVSDTNNMAATVAEPSVSDTNNMTATVAEPSMSNDTLARQRRLFYCDICDKHIKDLRSHIHAHTAVKQFKCTECSKSFRCSTHLSAHQKQHVSVKLVCSVCDKTFLRESNYKRHITECGFTPYKCKKCSKGFALPADLVIHMEGHGRETRFKCEECGHSFLDMERLNAHIKTNAHPDILSALGVMEKNLIEPFVASSAVTNPESLEIPSDHSYGSLSIRHSAKLYTDSLTARESSAKSSTDILTAGQSSAKSSSDSLTAKESSAKSSTDSLTAGQSSAKSSTDSLTAGQSSVNSSQSLKVYKCKICDKVGSVLHSHMMSHITDAPIKCTKCEKTFRMKCALKNHMFLHYESNVEQCQYCDKKFFYAFALRRHVASHTGDYPFKCVVCNRGFFKLREMHRHVSTHDGYEDYKPEADKIIDSVISLNPNINKISCGTDDENVSQVGNMFVCSNCSLRFRETDDLSDHTVFECNVCGKISRESATILSHLKEHTDDDPYKCSFCELTFSTFNCLKSHRKTHIETQHKCPTCDRVFRFPKKLLNHMRVHSEIRAFQCEVCHKAYRYKGDLKKHMDAHIEEKTFKCPVCNKAFSTNRRLKHHTMWSHGNRKKNSPSATKVYICNICGKNSTSYHQLRDHVRKHTGEKPFKCDICSKQFRTYSDLFSHKRVHSDTKPYKCPLCPKQYKSSHSLMVHKWDHTGYRPHPCKICGKSFRSQNKLIIHMRCHTGEMPFECSQCHKTFISAGQLKCHMKVHDKEKKYKCELCDRSFSQRGNLVIHQRVHTGERPYKCHYCEKSFKISCQLKDHIRTHTGERPFNCDVCPNAYSARKLLYSHMKTEHDTKKPFRCRKCFKAYVMKENLDLHSEIHRREEQEAQDVLQVEQQMVKPVSLPVHTVDKGAKSLTDIISVVRSNLAHCCSSCSSRFATAKELSMHKMTHLLKPFQCAVCSKTFTSPNLLSTHLVMHVSSDSYPCPHCDELFNDEALLRMHTEECVVSGRQAKVQKLAGKKQYECNICEKSFHIQSLLTAHKKIHIQCEEQSFVDDSIVMSAQKIINDISQQDAGLGTAEMLVTDTRQEGGTLGPSKPVVLVEYRDSDYLDGKQAERQYYEENPQESIVIEHGVSELDQQPYITIEVPSDYNENIDELISQASNYLDILTQTESNIS